MERQYEYVGVLHTHMCRDKQGPWKTILLINQQEEMKIATFYLMLSKITRAATTTKKSLLTIK